MIINSLVLLIVAQPQIEFHNTTESIWHLNQAFRIAAEVMAEKRNGDYQAVLQKLMDAKTIIYVRKIQYGEPGSCGTERNPMLKCHGFYCEFPPNGWCVGYYSPIINQIHYVKRECIADSALSHELIHLIEYLLTGDTNAGHDDSGLFPDGCVPIENLETRRVCYKESAERMIQTELRMFCD